VKIYGFSNWQNGQKEFWESKGILFIGFYQPLKIKPSNFNGLTQYFNSHLIPFVSS
jgi:hypothetical protein